MAEPRSTASAIALPPGEAIAYLRQKTNTPTTRWGEVWDEAHTKAFTVAGATSKALLNDFRHAVAKAIETGSTLATFRADFDTIVAKHGWEYNGTPAWRSQIIYETNLSMAYSAGRYAQMTEPDTLQVYPYWQYQHTSSARPRPQHLAWVGTTLRYDDAWWATHYPPNGWRCRCSVRPVSAAGLRRQGKDGPDKAPSVNLQPYRIPATGRQVMVPKGIDPGFGYNPGASWTGGPPPGSGAPMPPVIPPAPAAPPSGAEEPERRRQSRYRPRLRPAEAVAPPQPPTATATERAIDGFAARPVGTIALGELAPQAAAALDLGAAEAVRTVQLSAETMEKQMQRHPDLVPADYRQLPALLAAPERVLRQDARRLILLGKVIDGRALAVFVKATRDGVGRFLVSFRWAGSKDLRRLQKLYVEIEVRGNGAPGGPPGNPS